MSQEVGTMWRSVYNANFSPRSIEKEPCVLLRRLVNVVRVVRVSPIVLGCVRKRLPSGVAFFCSLFSPDAPVRQRQETRRGGGGGARKKAVKKEKWTNAALNAVANAATRARESPGGTGNGAQ